jgi:hypothetical protein
MKVPFAPRWSRAEVVVFLGTSLAALGLYAPRVCPSVVLAGDSPELIAAGAEWGVPHAPGFPLYTLLLHAVLRVPIASVAWRANMMSAALHALTVGVVAVTVLRLCSKAAPGRAAVAGAATAAIVLGTSGSFVFASLYAEVFPLTDLFVALLLLLALPLADDEPRAAAPPRLVALALVAGLASATHPFIAMLAPSLLVATYVALREGVRARPVRLLALALAFAVPFVGLYLLSLVAAARSPFVSWGDVHDLSSLARLFARTDYGGVLRTSRTQTSLELGTRLLRYGQLLLSGLGPVSLLLAVAGGGVRLWRSRRQGAALALAFLLPGPAFALMNSLFQSDPGDRLGLAARFMTMGEVPLAILAGAAVAAVCSQRHALHPVSFALPAVVALAIVPRALGTDLHADRTGDAVARDLLRDVPDGSLVLLSGDVNTGLAAYVCVVLHGCGSRMIVAPGQLFLDWYRGELSRRYPALAIGDDVLRVRDTHVLVERAIAHRPVYTTGHIVERDPALARDYAILPSLLLLELVPAEGPRGLSTLRAGWMARASALAEGNGCDACEDVARPSGGPTFEREVAGAYDAALANYAGTARRLGDTALADRLAARRTAMGFGDGGAAR